jgi:hypothetical protein
VAALAAALLSPACFTALTRLDLARNPLGDAGVARLATALRGHPPAKR